jgi:hypothetical protein
MNPEKAHSVAVHIDQLSGIGRALRDSSTSSDSYKITAWLGEIVSVFKNDFENNPAMLKEAEGLIKESSIKEGSIKEAKKPPSIVRWRRDLQASILIWTPSVRPWTAL